MRRGCRCDIARVSVALGAQSGERGSSRTPVRVRLSSRCEKPHPRHWRRALIGLYQAKLFQDAQASLRARCVAVLVAHTGALPHPGAPHTAPAAERCGAGGSPTEWSTLEASELRNTLIVAVQERSGAAVAELQAASLLDIVRRGEAALQLDAAAVVCPDGLAGPDLLMASRTAVCGQGASTDPTRQALAHFRDGVDVRPQRCHPPGPHPLPRRRRPPWMMAAGATTAYATL